MFRKNVFIHIHTVQHSWSLPVRVSVIVCCYSVFSIHQERKNDGKKKKKPEQLFGAVHRSDYVSSVETTPLSASEYWCAPWCA